MDTWILSILLFTCTPLAVVVAIVYWYWEIIRALIKLPRTLIFGPPVTKISRNFRANNFPYAAAGKIGLAIVIANQYEGAERLNGTAKDKERWERVFEYLQFDVRTSREVGLNASKEEMLRLCNLPQEIAIRRKDVPNYRFIAFVFSGHGYRDTSNNDVIVSQDGKSLSLESEVFPCLFGGRRGDCIKLIFIDACRSDPSQEKLALTKSHVVKALKPGNPTVHAMSDFTDDAFIAFATLRGLPTEDDSCGSIFSSSFTNLLQTDISLVIAMTKVTEEVLNSPTLHYFRPMSINMLSCDVNLYQSGKLVTGLGSDLNQVQMPSPVSNKGQIQAPDPNQGQHQDMDQGGHIPVQNSSTSVGTDSSTDGPGESEPRIICPLHGNLSSNEEIIQTLLPESDGGVMPSSQTGDPPVDESQHNRSTDPATNVPKSEAGTIPSSPQPPPSCHPPSSESQTADRTEQDKPLDGPTVPDQLSTSDHGTDSHVLNSPIQASQDSLHQSPPEPRGHHSMAPSVPHKRQDPSVPDNPVNVQHKENVPGSPPVAGEQPQQIQAGGQNNRYQVVSEGEGLQVAEQHRNMGENPQVPSDDRNMEGNSPVLPFNRTESAPVPDHHFNHPYVPQSPTMGLQGTHNRSHKDPNKLTIRALMPYIGELASLGLQISGWLDMSNEWAVITLTPGSPGDHLQQLLMEWLNGDEDPNVPHTWEHFISVVRNCKRGKLAEKMEREVFGSPGLHSYHSGPAEVFETSTTIQGPDRPHSSQSEPVEVHETSTTIQGSGLHSYHSEPAEVHETSTTIQGPDRPHSSQSEPVGVHETSTTVQGPGLHSYHSGPAEVHETSTNVQVLDSKPRECDALKLVDSETSVNPPNLQTTVQPSGYRYIDCTTRHIQAVISNFPSLKLTRKDFVHQNGTKEELACLCGTIPVPIKGSTCHIPMRIFLPKDYPYHCPTCLVQPTADMMISPSQYVNTRGMVSLPYLHEWKHTQSDLTTLIQIMCASFSERAPVCSKGRGVTTLTDRQIMIQLSGYRYVAETMEHVQAVIRNFPTLKLTRKDFIPQNGTKEKLACLCGTIPVHIKGSTYHIPVGIYLRKDYPYHCPTCLVQPTLDMRISPSQYVNTRGMVSLPYLHEWKHTQSDLTTLIQIMCVAFSERSPVFRKGLSITTLTDCQITIQLSGYHHVDETMEHVQAVIRNFPSLKLTRKDFVPQNGTKEELACLCGTIPVHIKGSKYHIPVGIFLRKDYPYHCPTCLVQPTADMMISPSQYVNTQGMVSFPYLHEWKHTQSDLTTLIQIMCASFSESSPVCMRPRGQQQDHNIKD